MSLHVEGGQNMIEFCFILCIGSYPELGLHPEEPGSWIGGVKFWQLDRDGIKCGLQSVVLHSGLVVCILEEAMVGGGAWKCHRSALKVNAGNRGRHRMSSFEGMLGMGASLKCR